MNLSIIIPVYNEERYIDTIIQKIKAVSLPSGIEKEIIVVDDKSTDSTPEILQKYTTDPCVKLCWRSKNLGKAAALKLGISQATGDIYLIQDADLEYDPSHYPCLIQPLLDDRADVVYGSRFKGEIKNMAFINRVANIISNLTLNLFFASKITDVNTCYKVFKAGVLKDMALTSGKFMFETEVTAKVLKQKLRLLEIPIHYTARTKAQGKKINWPQAVQMYWGIIKYRFKS